MQVKFYKTADERLKPYLEGYYFLKKEAVEDVEYLTFPNNFISVSVYHKVGVNFQDNNAVISQNDNLDFTSILVASYKSPIKVNYNGKINEVTFCFKPLGLNSFLPNLSVFFNSSKSFLPFDDYRETMTAILNESSDEVKIIMLENYWLSKLNDFNHLLLDNLVSEMLKVDEQITITELALKYDTSRQNIHKLFSRYVGKNPADFRKIHRFREALSKRIDSLKEEKNLTVVGYEALFYDQSHMVKAFKSLTGFTPKQFFEGIELKNGAGNWFFTK